MKRKIGFSYEDHKKHVHYEVYLKPCRNKPGGVHLVAVVEVTLQLHYTLSHNNINPWYVK